MKSAENAVRILNEMLAADPEATSLLVESRVRVNKAIEDHPTIVCNGDGHVGLLGVLNGIFGPEEKIAAEYNDDSNPTRVTKFIVWKD